jgi:hypothetical protein
MQNRGGQHRRCNRTAFCLTANLEVKTSLNCSRYVERSTYKEQECSEAKKEKEWARQICIIHDVLVDTAQRVQDRQ